MLLCSPSRFDATEEIAWEMHAHTHWLYSGVLISLLTMYYVRGVDDLKVKEV
jgi:hypothetical protein